MSGSQAVSLPTLGVVHREQANEPYIAKN